MVQRLHPHPYLSLFNGPDTSVTTADARRLDRRAPGPLPAEQPVRPRPGAAVRGPADRGRARPAGPAAPGLPPGVRPGADGGRASAGRASSWRDTSGAWPTRACPPTGARASPGPAWPGPCSPRTSSSTWIDGRATGSHDMAADPLNRRALLRRASAFAAAGGLGLYRQLSIAAAANAGHPLAPEAGPLPGEGEAPDRLLHDGRVLAPRHVRLQAEAPEGPRQDRSASTRSWPRPTQFRPRGECGEDGQRAVRARRRGRRRPLLPAHGPRRLGRPLGRDPGHAHRLGHDPAAEPRLVDQLRPGHAQHEPAVVRRARGQGAVQRLPGLGLELPARLSQGRARDPRPRPAARREEPGGVGHAARAGRPDAPRPERGPPLGPRRRRGPGRRGWPRSTPPTA